jgi:hypothetical protein
VADQPEQGDMISRASLVAGGVVRLIFGLLRFHLINIAVWRPAAVKEGRDRLIAEQATADRKSEIERKGEDAKLWNFLLQSLC